MKLFDKLNKETQEYLRASADRRRVILKERYLASAPSGVSEREQALFHLGHLVENTRRLNMIECKGSGQPLPKPSAIRETDLFVCVEICAEGIRENMFLKNCAELWGGWTAFEELLQRLKSTGNSEHFFEAAYLLLYLAALIFKRHVADRAVEREPQVFSLEGYKAAADGFAQPLFDSVDSSVDQLNSLTKNLHALSRF
jgi:hypothetical protein